MSAFPNIKILPGAPYKEFAALLTVTVVQQTSGLLIPGERYFIRLRAGNGSDSFANVGTYICGADVNLQGQGTMFLATGTTPSNWTQGSILERLTYSFNVLGNTIGGSLSVLMDSDTASASPGLKYWINILSSGLFTASKTLISSQDVLSYAVAAEAFLMHNVDSSTITLKRMANNTLGALAIWASTAVIPINIRVYP